MEIIGYPIKNNYITKQHAEEYVRKYYNKQNKTFPNLKVVLLNNSLYVLPNEKQVVNEIEVMDVGTVSNFINVSETKEQLVNKIQEHMNFRLWFYISYQMFTETDKLIKLIDDIYNEVGLKKGSVIVVTATGLRVVKEKDIPKTRGNYLTRPEHMLDGVKQGQNEVEIKKVIVKNIKKLRKNMGYNIKLTKKRW